MTSRVLSILAAVTSVVVLCCTAAQAQIPRTINYQGYLTSPSGAAVNASVQMVFRLYDAVTGGNQLHTETQPTVVVSNGIFNVVLGTTALTASFSAPYWLGVTVGADAEMSPRQPLAASPYAITAQNIAPGGNIVLTHPSTASAGNIMKGGNRFIHNYGTDNTFVGQNAGNFFMSGGSNTAIGALALQSNTGGSFNTASGWNALGGNTGNYNAAFGASALSSSLAGDFNIGIGHDAGNLTTGSWNIAIGHLGVAGESGIIRIGNSNTHSAAFLAGNVGVGATSQLPFPPRMQVAASSPKATVASTRALAVTSNDAVAPFALDVKVVGAAALVNRGVILQTTDWNTADGGNLLLQPQGGKVGIGTTNPTKALVEINGFANNTLLGTVGLFSPSGAGSQIPQQALAYSLYASNLVAANSYVAFSDQRIKRMTGRSDTAKDLTTLAAIEITNYTYIDSANLGNKPHKKVIAQQVEKVYPQALSQMTDVVPDIYLKADIRDGWIKLATNLKKGERVRLIGKTANGVFEVLDVAANRFRTDFKADADTVFVYGREVQDFRSVDYEAIAMLNVSATQEINRNVAQLSRRIEAQAAEIAQLKTQLAILAQLQAQVAEIAKANTTQIAYRPTLN